jgi:hypothetical protein
LNELAVLDDDALNAVINASQGIAGDCNSINASSKALRSNDASSMGAGRSRLMSSASSSAK